MLTSLAALALVRPSVLVFSKTSAFRHDSIPAGVAAIRQLGAATGWRVEATENSSIFLKSDLSKFSCVIFLSTTGDVLTAREQTGFEKYLEAGGGMVGIHAAADCEYDWPWYGRTIGAYFKSHPRIQKAKIVIEDRNHPSTKFLPKTWEVEDEWYNFQSNPRSKVHVLASLDEKSYEGGSMGDHPIMWTNTVGKGRVWYTNLGHRQETWSNGDFLKSVREGIQWVSQ